MSSHFTSGFLLFPGLTQLDLTGPYEVLTRIPNSRGWLIAADASPVVSDCGLAIVPTTTFADAPKLDLICIPGGPGTLDAAADPAVIEFVRCAAAQAEWVTSVCTGSLILGAAGLLRGRRATSHWAFRHLLAEFGAEPVAERVVEDGNLITGGGVTAGIDFGLTVLSRVAGQEVAELVQLSLEYDPQPPFDAGSPSRAPEAVVQAYREKIASLLAAREAAVKALAAKL
jgi:cyclohexyl-isocyanide hydratase